MPSAEFVTRKAMTENRKKVRANMPELQLECKSEDLSEAQVNKVSKVREDLLKLQHLLTNGLQHNGVTPGVNGMTGSTTVPQVATPVTQPLPNGGMFLLLPQGQMLTSSAGTVTPAGLPTSSVPTSSSMSTLIALPNSAAAASTTKTVSSQPSQQSGMRTRTSTRGSAALTASTNASSSPDIEVVKEMRPPVQPSTTMSASSSATTSGSKSFPLLTISARPKHQMPPSVFMAQRKELDAKVKTMLIKSSQEFVEWLLSEGLIRNAQYCPVHKQTNHQPIKLKLGMFSDPKVLGTSGGYVWLSECCGKKYVSVFSGSLFGSTPIDKVPATSVLKLVYHWACQTSISNIENWVKVDKAFINKMFQYLRCICAVMLQDKVYDFGFDGTTVELGIVSLGTSTADGAKKAVKVEILGLYDRKMKSYRLFASEPEPGTSSRQRFVRILKPLERVVHPNAIILCDLSVDRNCLYNMNFSKVNVCETSDNEENTSSNAKIMAYLRRHVPKMFQSTLSQLSLEQVQVVLDELCWRERFGNSSSHAYSNMMEHITYLTAREAENPGVLHLLDSVSQKPQNNWRYKSQHIPRVVGPLQPSVIMHPPAGGAINPVINSAPVYKPLQDHSNKVPVTPRNRKANYMVQTPQKASSMYKAVELEPYYYGQIQGDPNLGREINTYTFSCHICSKDFTSNINFYTHLKLHLTSKGDTTNMFSCKYCTELYPSESVRDVHQKMVHQQMDARSIWCRICSESFQGETSLLTHMAKRHCESELPYRCEVCNFATSIYYSAIDHFQKEHADTPYIQCHFCLTVKTISSASAASFAQRMFQHMMKHMTSNGKCKSCCLTFYSKYLQDEHKRKDHVTRATVTGLQRYKVPANARKILFHPSLRNMNPSQLMIMASPQQATTSVVAISTTLVKQDNLKINMEQDNLYCIECDGNLKLDQHFKAYQKCTKCQYSTCCRSMMSKHAPIFHPVGRARRIPYKLGPPIVLPRPLYCICGFNTRSGNHLARHLALCEGGRKSAYPSIMDAMVYHGDHMTGGALSLANLGLQGSISLEGLAMMPPEHLLDQSAPALDMSHFMSMTMEVDD